MYSGIEMKKLSNSKGLRMEAAVISESGCGPEMVRRLEKKTSVMVVENYSSIRNINAGIQSQEFVCGGHRWAILFCPQGHTSDVRYKKGFVSIYITRTTQATRDQQCLLNIQLLGRSGNKTNLGLGRHFYREVVVLEPRHRVYGCPNYMTHAELDSPSSPYVKNDSLKIRVFVGVFTYHAGPRWWGGEIFIHVADRGFYVPKSALLYHAPKLISYDRRGQLQDIVLSDADPLILRVALAFITTDLPLFYVSADFNDSDPLNLESFAAKLLALADTLQIRLLKINCEAELSTKISRESVAHLLHLAQVCKAAKLKSACLKFLARNRLVINNHKSQLLNQKCPLLCLELPQELEDSPFLQDINPSTTLKQEVLKMYNTVVKNARKFKLGRHWPRFSANKIKQF